MRSTDALFLVVIIGLIVACVVAYLLEMRAFNKLKKRALANYKDNFNKAIQGFKKEGE